MKQEQMDMLKYRHASLMVSRNSSPGQVEDSTTIIGLLDMITLYQDELDRLHRKLVDAERERAE